MVFGFYDRVAYYEGNFLISRCNHVISQSRHINYFMGLITCYALTQPSNGSVRLANLYCSSGSTGALQVSGTHVRWHDQMQLAPTYLVGQYMLHLPVIYIVYRRGWEHRLRFNLRGIHFPDTPVGAQKWSGKLLPDRFRPRKLADNSSAPCIRVIR